MGMRFMMIPAYRKGQSTMADGYVFDVDMHKEGHDDIHKEVSPGMRIVHHVLESPPDTWKQYQGRPDGHFKIVEMESAELQTAHSSYKSGVKTKEDVIREFSHTAAACIAAINALMAK